ncbi:MAG TPA: ATP-binding protein [Clostridiaceae bacterium]|jgi:anti-sigma regulatory factor (Ser/Thr protein kinase)|nr:ATP-binding protein [Clostridiaceae bacterium]
MRDISLHLMDIVQNSIKASATKIVIRIFADKDLDKMRIEIEDNGQGMDDELLIQVKNPFVTTRTTRKVGLGLPLLDASANRAGGGLSVKSEKGKGTIIQAVFQISHIDRIPLGDVSETMMTLIAANPEIDFQLVLCNMEKSFDFSLSEIRAQIGEISVDQIEILMWIKEYINEGVIEIFGGVLSEIYS